MSRIHSLVLVLGVLLIGIGVLVDRRSNPPGGARSGPDGRAGSPSDLGRAFDRGSGESGVVRAAARTGTDPAAPHVVARLRHRGDGTPAEGAHVSLWRRARGAGAAHRPARRIAPDQTADSSGVVRFVALAEFDLELVARARGAGPTVRTPIPALGDGARYELDIEVERPPAPLSLVVLGAVDAPLAGASILGVQRASSWDTTGDPNTHEPIVLRRTNGAGVADLDGSVRGFGWLVVEAAGFAPVALSQETIARSGRRPAQADRREELTLTLSPAAALKVRVERSDGVPLGGALLRVSFTLDGMACARSARTNRLGVARIGGLPARTPIAASVTKKDSNEVLLRETYELESGRIKDVSVGP